jgi:hypothetical protein
MLFAVLPCSSYRDEARPVHIGPLARSRGKQIDGDDEARTTPSFSISFDLFPHLKKLLRVVVQNARASAIRIPARDANACAVGLLTYIERSESGRVGAPPARRPRMVLVNPRFHPTSRPANVASKLSERAHPPRHHE